MTLTEIRLDDREAHMGGNERAIAFVADASIHSAGSTGDTFYFACSCGERFQVDASEIVNETNIDDDTLAPKCPACGSVRQ